MTTSSGATPGPAVPPPSGESPLRQTLGDQTTPTTAPPAVTSVTMAAAVVVAATSETAVVATLAEVGISEAVAISAGATLAVGETSAAAATSERDDGGKGGPAMPADKCPSWHMLLTAAGCLALVPTARGQVNNRAGLFTLEAVKKADERIGEIKSRPRLGKWIVVDTFKEPPATEPKKNLENAELREKFFEEWARQRVAETGLKGVHVLWCQTPRHVQVTATAGTEDLFSPWSQHNLRRYLKKKLEPPPEKRGA